MSRAEKRALNQHLHRKHGGASMVEVDGLRNRLMEHEELHRTTVCDHEHEDYELPAEYRDLVKDA